MPKLNRVTWFFVFLAVVELLATIWATADTSTELLRQYRLGDRSIFTLFGTMITQYFYALNWLGTAAMVEVLIRIWTELKSPQSQAARDQKLT